MAADQRKRGVFKTRNFEGMTERLKVADCKSVRFSYVGSNPTFFIGLVRVELTFLPL